MRFVIVTLLVLLAVAMCVQDITSDAPNDLSQDWLAGRALLDGRDAYAPQLTLAARYDVNVLVPRGSGATPHPPAHVVIVGLLALVPFQAARLIWFALSLAALVAAGLIFTRRYRFPWWLAVVPLVLPFTHADLAAGQTSCVLLLLFVLAERHELFAGIAAALKVYPILIAFRRRPRWTILLAAAILTIIAVLLIGVEPSLRWMTHTSPENLRIWIRHPVNISIAGLLARLGFPTTIAALAPILPALWLIRRRGYWQATPLIVLASPIAWPHYALICLPALMFRGRAGLAVAIVISLASATDHFGWLAALSLTALAVTEVPLPSCVSASGRDT